MNTFITISGTRFNISKIVEYGLTLDGSQTEMHTTEGTTEGHYFLTETPEEIDALIEAAVSHERTKRQEVAFESAMKFIMKLTEKFPLVWPLAAPIPPAEPIIAKPDEEKP